jgi:hypothetical protein
MQALVEGALWREEGDEESPATELRQLLHYNHATGKL